MMQAANGNAVAALILGEGFLVGISASVGKTKGKDYNLGSPFLVA
jgi:hypothetical protein